MTARCWAAIQPSFVGTYQESGGEVTVEISAMRHYDDPNFQPLFKTDTITLALKGRQQGERHLSRGRVQLLITPQRWFARLFEARGVQLAEMSPDVLIASSFLPGKPPRDPADRIIAATARDLGATLITRDRVLLDYGRQGHLSVVEC
ncbi:type II toxin-antitoxin system VapC family toxin [Bradyrhizobium sp.]|uniref:type II toxin-antitoxin system VapC family toxin n=1 Tax=Bradyrhizobium sp. TaxID=376 RepID=UPI002716108E|nr:type II toxin-antitoxin system VapC family toxin [Bradyrhizobium sp.]MDO9298829.1 type II toxin-antitoxin system VapC family toxin [Bradyrhizobium sp.]